MENTLNQNLLEAYSDVNNVSKKGSTILKILVGYIKPSFLFKSDILIPIHLGREVAKESSKDDIISDEDYQWLLDNTIGDNDYEENISHFNRRIGFLTGTYWAWKNYEKLGSPDYFGFFGYRRLLSPLLLKDIEEYDFILPKPKKAYPDIRQQYISMHGLIIYNSTIDIITKLYPNEADDIQEYFNRTSGYFREIYILKKDLFFEFCEWIFPVLFELLQINKNKLELNKAEKQKIIKNNESIWTEEVCNEQNFDFVQKRDLGFIIERITGYYLYKLTKNNNLKYLEVNMINTKPSEEIIRRKKRILQQLRKNVHKGII